MAILDVLTVYQSWKGFQLFDEVMVQMHRYQFTSIHVSVESTKPAEVYTTDTAES